MNESLRLLIVEDEPGLLNVLADYYAGRGLQVSRAETIAAAREHLEQHRFDAVLLDVHLPDGDGMSLLGPVPPERALAITSKPDLKRFARLGIGCVPKPFDLSVLNRALEGILELPHEATP